ncbi:MAG TPA: hypothetical protein VFL91_28110 [Thermomicrobiales bacterium]|nr:hypothetical protein [Thermomicrobiales bacterium]
MGLDAFVRCNCWKEGRTTPPPVPRELIYEDEEGLELRLPFDGKEEMYFAFDRWMLSCCEHEDMSYARVRVSNWSGYRLFQQALERAGWEHFPTLEAELPNANGGQMSPGSAAKALAELRYFCDQADLGENTFLVDAETGEELRAYVASYAGMFAFAAHYELGFDPNGFYVLDESVAPPKELFRSCRFEQRFLEPLPMDANYGGPVELIDLVMQERAVSPMAITGHEIPWPDGRMENDQGSVRNAYPRFLEVTRRRVTSADYDYILDPLTEIFEASVEIGNPVIWC